MIACHGRLASGVVSTLKLFVGEEEAEKIVVADAYADDTDHQPIMQAFVNSCKEDNEKGIIFTDFSFGSVNQQVLGMTTGEDLITVITGFNPSLLMEIILSKPESEEEIEASIEMARGEMKISKLEIIETEETGEDSFFD